MLSAGAEGVPLRAQVGNLLRTVRLAAGISQIAFANQLEVSSRTLMRWEAAESTIDLGELEVVGRALGLRLVMVALPDTAGLDPEPEAESTQS